MIRLKGNGVKILLIILLVTGAFALSFALPPIENEGEEKIKYAPRIFFGRERGMDYPPAFFWENNQTLHYLGLNPGRDAGLNYLILDKDLKKLEEKGITLKSDISVNFLFPVGINENEGVFGIVSREQGTNQPYLVFPNSESEILKPLEKSISRHHDISAQIYGGKIYVSFVEREGREYRLWLMKVGGDSSLVFSSQGFLGLPRMVIGENGTIHLQWKGSKNDRGIAKYQAFNYENFEPKMEKPLELGFASYYFGEHDEQPLYFSEDPGADLLVADNDFVYLTWTDSIWEPSTMTHRSTLKIAKMTSEGHKDALWRVEGNNPSFFGNLFINEKGKIGVIWEEYFGRQFNLMYTYLDDERDVFSDPERITEVYGSNRLPRVENNPEGEFILLAREVDGSNDEIWGITSGNPGKGKWYHSWKLWFAEEGIGGIIVEGSLIVLYSFIASLGLIARNALSLLFIVFMLYLLQKFRILGRINSFQFIGLLLVLLFFFREYIPLFYGTPPADFGLMLFSGVFATAIVLWISRDNWFKGGEEFLYLYYTLVWVFSDTFLMYLALAPGNFMP